MSNKINHPVKLSAALISFNEEERIKTTLESLKELADEIVIIDSNSTDRTALIASTYGAKFITKPWSGFRDQKNALFGECSGQWILYLDCDEEVTELLAKEIQSTIAAPETLDGYFINRRTSYLGKILKFSWQPDMKLRLVKRSSIPSWDGEYVHESLSIDGKTGQLQNEIIHHSYKNLSDHMAKTLKYASLAAEAAFANGKKPSVAKIVFAPPLMFFKSYLLKGGFMDGLRGLMASFSAYVYFFLKYSFLWEKYHTKGRKDEK